MDNSREELRRMARMLHDRLWLEGRFGIQEGEGLGWPAKPPDAATSPRSPAKARPPSAAPTHPQAPATSRPASRRPPTPPPAPSPANATTLHPEPGPFLDTSQEPDPEARLRLLGKAIDGCTRCGLAKNRTKLVFGEGNPTPQLLFIGEGPGSQEDRQGRPFVGPAGQLLDRIIEAMGMKRDQVYIANVVKCHPPGDRPPTPIESAACLPYLLAQIAIVRPKVICLLGATAAHAMIPRSEGIMTLRGRWFEFQGIPMMPTFHPAYLLRNPQAKKLCWDDVQKVRDKVRELAGSD